MADGTPSAEAIAVSLARACLREGTPAAATAALPAWTGEAANAAPLILRLEAGLLSAVAEYRGGHPHRAFHTLERVLELAEPEGFRRAFTRADPFVRRLLADQLDAGTRHWALVLDLLGAADVPVGGDRLPSLAEPLTDREITVLRRLQGTQPNQEIAADLSVSVNTIKTHVRSIYRKLDVRRRRDAVTKAREFELI